MYYVYSTNLEHNRRHGGPTQRVLRLLWKRTKRPVREMPQVLEATQKIRSPLRGVLRAISSKGATRIDDRFGGYSNISTCKGALLTNGW